MASKFPAWIAWVALAAGVLYLLADLKILSGWKSISWYTVAFILIGFYLINNK